MAFTAPTAADLKARFPTFAAVADATIDVALAEAALMVDDAWLSQEDFTLGRLLYAAHILTLDGFGTGAEAQSAAAGTSEYTTIRSGRLQLTKAGAGNAPAAQSVLTKTTFGQRFREVLDRNRSGPLVANVLT